MANGNTQTVSVSTGGGWAILATIVLVVLKVNPGGNLDSAVQDWPWWLVLIPLWLGLAILLTILIVGGIVVLLGTLISDARAKRRRKKALEARLEARQAAQKERLNRNR